jgi:hypothetical protein
MDQESLINGLAAIGALAVLYVIFRLLATIAEWVQRDAIEHDRADAQKGKPARKAAPQAAPQLQEEDVAENDIAVIAAAVQAMIGTNHHVVHIQDTHGGQSWSAEGRWMHQTSHHPH